MKKLFAGYYRPTPAEFRSLWNNCIFVLDANALLNLYRYSQETRKKLLEILQQVSDRLWVPHQAALEYQRNRLNVITKQREAYNEIESLLQETKRKLESGLRSYSKHPLISPGKLLGPINAAFDAEIKELQSIREKHPDLFDQDPVRDELTQILTGKVGAPYEERKCAELRKQGAERYAKGVPPGYIDSKSKSEDREFGDFILWNQALEKAGSDKKPIVIVTDDVKEDWWWRHEGKIVGPRPELVEEMKSTAGVPFYMYQTDQFMEYAREFLKSHVDERAIKEIREIRRHDEARLVQLEEAAVRRFEQRQLFERQRRSLSVESERVRAEIHAAERTLAEILARPEEQRRHPNVQGARAIQEARIEQIKMRSIELSHRLSELDRRLAVEELTLTPPERDMIDYLRRSPDPHARERAMLEEDFERQAVAMREEDLERQALERAMLEEDLKRQARDRALLDEAARKRLRHLGSRDGKS